jgi:O-antigen polymerase
LKQLTTEDELYSIMNYLCLNKIFQLTIPFKIYKKIFCENLNYFTCKLKRTYLYYLLISLVLLTPFIHSENLYNGIISAKQIWFNGSMALLVLIFAFDQLFNRKKIFIKPNNIDIALLLFYIYIFIRATFTPYTPILYNTRFLNYSLLVIFYFLIKSIICGLDLHKEKSSLDDGKKKREVIPFAGILVLVLISTGLVQAVWGLLQLYGITRSFHSNFKITGTFFNPAPYALYLAAIFPLALGNMLEMNKLETINDNRMTIQGLITYIRNTSFGEACKVQMTFVVNKLSSYISLLTVISILLVLPATMNRASWLGVTIGSLFVFNYRYDLINRAKLFLHSTFRTLVAVVIITLLIGLSGVGLYHLKKGSSDGKLLIWEVTSRKIAEKPLFGYGVGRFEAEYNNWQSKYFKTHVEAMNGPKGMVAGNTKYCFNEYIEVTSELGVIGFFLFFIVLISVFKGIRNTKMEMILSQPKDLKVLTNEAPINLTIISSSFISLLVCAFISFPFYSLPTQIVFFLQLAILSSYVKETKVHCKLLHFISLNWARVVTIFIFFSISILLLLLTNNKYKAYATWNEAELLYQNTNYYDACELFSESYNTMQYNGEYLQYYGKAMNMDGKYFQSIKILERAKYFNSDNVLYINLGDTYKTLERYSEAEVAYEHASSMIPHKLYPRYLLTNLYYETGQIMKAYKTAQELLNKEVKIESNATKEIRNAMSALITKMEKCNNEQLFKDYRFRKKKFKK